MLFFTFRNNSPRGSLTQYGVIWSTASVSWTCLYMEYASLKTIRSSLCLFCLCIIFLFFFFTKSVCHFCLYHYLCFCWMFKSRGFDVRVTFSLDTLSLCVISLCESAFCHYLFAFSLFHFFLRVIFFFVSVFSSSQSSLCLLSICVSYNSLQLPSVRYWFCKKCWLYPESLFLCVSSCFVSRQFVIRLPWVSCRFVLFFSSLTVVPLLVSDFSLFFSSICATFCFVFLVPLRLCATIVFVSFLSLCHFLSKASAFYHYHYWVCVTFLFAFSATVCVGVSCSFRGDSVLYTINLLSLFFLKPLFSQCHFLVALFFRLWLFSFMSLSFLCNFSFCGTFLLCHFSLCATRLLV